MSFTYEVVREGSPFFGEDGVVDGFDNPSDALKLRDQLRLGDPETWYYVTVTWGSIDNV